MVIDVITAFPDYFAGPLAQSMMRKAAEQGLVEFNVHDLRQWGLGQRRQIDDLPYGGGAGMVLRPEPLFAAFADLSKDVIPAKPSASRNPGSRVRVYPAPDVGPGMTKRRRDKIKQAEPYRIYLTPQGKPFQQTDAARLSQQQHLILLAGHYEGIDQRVRDECIDQEISIGDYVLTGGELPALVVIDAVVRLIPGVLGDETSGEEESFSKALGGGLEYPHYTRPEEFRGLKVPEVLLSGNHADIKKWRNEEMKRYTKKVRPDITST